MPGGDDPLRNDGPVPEAGPKFTDSSSWPPTSSPTGTPTEPESPGRIGGPILTYTQLPGISLEPLADVWQVLLDGRLLFGKGTVMGITAYTGMGLPGQRNADVALPTEHGVVALGDYHGSRSIVFSLNTCKETPGDLSAAEAWDVLRYVAGVWQARTANVLLELRMTTAQTYVLIGRPRKFDADVSGLRKGVVSVAAEFVATDPRLYDVELSQDTLLDAAGEDVVGGLCLGPDGLCLGVAPWGDDQCALNIPRIANGEGTFVNRGNTDTHPIVTFFGPVANPTIHNLTTDRLLGLAATLAPGEVAQVDMRLRDVRYNGTLRYDLLASQADFWPLVPGNNEVRLRQTDVTGTTATLTWRDAWL